MTFIVIFWIRRDQRQQVWTRIWATAFLLWSSQTSSQVMRNGRWSNVALRGFVLLFFPMARAFKFMFLSVFFQLKKKGYNMHTTWKFERVMPFLFDLPKTKIASFYLWISNFFFFFFLMPNQPGHLYIKVNLLFVKHTAAVKLLNSAPPASPTQSLENKTNSNRRAKRSSEQKN